MIELIQEDCEVTGIKIKINDDPDLRGELDKIYEKASQLQLCRYGLLLADHILSSVDKTYLNNEIIKEGFQANKKWQNGEVRMHDVRQAGFKVHKLARESTDPVTVSATLRVACHAIATGHMKEHAMVASDYAIKVINLKYPDCIEEIRKERLWQIEQLKEIVKDFSK